MACNSSSWTWEQDKAFEIALAIYSEDLSDRWENIAAMVPGKTVEEIKQHYLILVEDINAIESGLVPLPCYKDSANCGGKKGIAWTEEEHRLFLLGLEKYGKGDWKSISRYFVKSRTPAQVASHAQKYFVRLSLANKERRRSSIHDITNVDGGDSSTPQGPITGEMVGGSSRRSGNPTPSTDLHVSTFIPPTIVESTDSPLISETDIPMNLPSPPPVMLYDVAAPPPLAYLGPRLSNRK